MKMKIPAFVLCLGGILMMSAGCDGDATPEAESTQASAKPGRQVARTSSARISGTDSDTYAEKYVPASEVLNAEHPALLALSAEEAAWLDRQDYPTSKEMDALLTYDVEELTSATRNQKSRKAAVLLGHRELMDGDVEGAWAAFSTGANLGSLYAMQQLAMINTHQATGLPMEDLAEADQGNLGVMVAQLEVARMLGDHRAQALIDRYSVNFDWDHYGKHVLRQTGIFMDQYGEFARARGEPVRGPDPRPNAAAWDQLKQDPDALVKVYTRSHPDP